MIESRESSSPIVTRAVAAGLAGKSFTAYEFKRFEKIALEILGYLPMGLSKWIIPRFQSINALDPEAIRQLRLSQIIEYRLNDYADLPLPVDSMIIGAAMGGTSAHLALATRSLFLPEAFVLTLKGGSPDGDVEKYFNLGFAESMALSENNPEIIAIQHYDPVHDGWLTRSVHHLRLKLLQLPQAYQDYIRKNLKPGGEIIHLDCQAAWLRYRLGPRNIFQVGGWGGIPPEEFIEGSARLDQYCRENGLMYSKWKLSGLPLEVGPESEWGSEESLSVALNDFARENGYRYYHFCLPSPNDYSLLALMAFSRLYEKAGVQPRGIFVGMFSQFDPAWTLMSHHLPVWLIFNTGDSCEVLQRILQEIPASLPVYLSLLATFSITPDMAAWEEWLETLKGRKVIQVGARKSHYPCDTRALIHWQNDYHALSTKIGEIQSRISAQELSELTAQINR